ncbi:1-aminocyclopropane-1-carboxylate deaminase/D-cysteine desulfhydrase [Tenacibaculum sp. SG-28]|uniref:1-aminocyclopropane-1-carboxylate deaminase/D-cysteine desulfhydrase n=1 Tax=Tenacibaculum sp. SG-28 TaxID=754426 RepID=UPI000CF36C63|nr:pyridoxal-phosphate dependent enzyme [Tenacibaculum sp. SG-28]PQJ22860.1 1-aminocyclopropane-1-carboxylate deaminase [Tenacibaculum sp. SG-28]
MMFNWSKLSINQPVFLPLLQEKNVSLFVKREDKIHPHISGNKFRKLKYNIAEAQEQNKNVILTFGGAYSNHIAATAAFGKLAGIQTIGVIRGEELGLDLERTLQKNSTLALACKNGMHLTFISRTCYRNKTATSFLKSLSDRFGDFYVIPEGGTNALAVKGCEEILSTDDSKFDYICTAVGTGGTIAGLINAKTTSQKILGFPALKGDFLANEILDFVPNQDGWSLENTYHFGGYGKVSEELITFINNFFRETSILLDPIYTGKMMYGVIDLIKKDYFPKGSKILAIHTGGLQGIAGINTKLQKRNLPLIIKEL